jgi:hypothetical protein
VDSSGTFQNINSISCIDGIYNPRVELDRAGNVYVGGSFYNNLKYIPGSVYQAQSNSTDMFIIKYNCYLQPMWMRQIGGSSDEFLRAFKVDYAGNIYTTASCEGGVSDLDPGAGTYTFAISSSQDIVISKLNSSGNFVWGRHLTGVVGEDIPLDIDADDGGVIVAGSFQHTVDFNPGVGVFTVAANGYFDDAFLLKLDTGGVFQWVQVFAGNLSDASQGVYIHPQGSIHHTGYFAGTIDMDTGPTTLTVSSSAYPDHDMFVRKLWQPCHAPPAPVNLLTANIQTVCAGNPATLISSSTGTVNWYTTSSGGNHFYSGYQLTLPSVTATTIFYSEAKTCTTSLSRTAITVSVIPNPLPLVTASVSNATVCPGATVSFSASGASTYTWFPVTLLTASHIPLSTGIYTVTGTNTSGCIGTATLQVVLLPQPQVIANISPTLICQGQSATLTSMGTASSYTWSGPFISGTVAVPNNNSTYTLSGTGSNGCVSRDTISIYLEQQPTLDVFANSYSVCPGQTVYAFGASQNLMQVLSFSWSHGITQNVPFTPTAGLVYTVTGTSTLGCTGTTTLSIFVHPSFILNALVSPTVICAGQSVSLTAQSSVSTYTWTGPAISGSVATPTVNTTYSLTGKGPGNCIKTSYSSVTVHPATLMQVTPSATAVCYGTQLTLNATGNGHTITWSGGITNNQPFIALGTANYSATMTNTLTGCQAITASQVTVFPLPVVLITGTSLSICAGQSVSLQATGASNYTWNTGQYSSALYLTPVSTTVYSVYGKSAHGCVSANSTSQTITVNQLPAVTLNGNLLICEGESTTLTASGAANYTWSSGAQATSIVVSPSTSTTYFVNGENNLGCINFSQSQVTVNPAPLIQLSASNTSICSGQSVSLYAAGANSYTWNTGQLTNSLNVSPNLTTVYSVIGKNSLGCVSTSLAMQTITVHLTPAVSIAGATLLCNGLSHTLTASGAASYTWGTGQHSGMIVVSPTVNTSFTVEGATNAGCSNTAQIQTSVIPSPTLFISGTTKICQGDTAHLFASGAVSYSWNGSPGNYILSAVPLISTVYTLTGAGPNGCSSQTFTSVKVLNVTANVVAGSSIICVGSPVSLNATGGGHYLWSTADTSQQIIVTPLITSVYHLTVTGVNGCKSTTQVAVFVDNCLGVEKENEINITVFPNPNNGAFTVSSPSELSIFLYNELGELVHFQNEVLGYIQIDGLASGVYFINVKTRSKTTVRKIIVL